MAMPVSVHPSAHTLWHARSFHTHYNLLCHLIIFAIHRLNSTYFNYLKDPLSKRFVGGYYRHHIAPWPAAVIHGAASPIGHNSIYICNGACRVRFLRHRANHWLQLGILIKIHEMCLVQRSYLYQCLSLLPSKRPCLCPSPGYTNTNTFKHIC